MIIVIKILQISLKFQQEIIKNVIKFDEFFVRVWSGSTPKLQRNVKLVDLENCCKMSGWL